MKRIIIILSVFSGLLIAGCKKDLDFNKFDNMTLSPEFGIPLAIMEMKMSDLIKQDSSAGIYYDPDGFIKYIQHEDSVAFFPVDSIVSIPPIAPMQIKNSLGEITIDNTVIEQQKTLGDMASNFNSSTKAALDAVAGTVSIFPSLSDQNNTVTTLDLGSSQFDHIYLSQGFLVMDFRNELPVTIDEIKVNIYNTSPFQVFIGQLVFNNIASNTSKKDSLNLAGVTLSNSLGYSLPSFKTFASSSPVLVNLNDKIKFNIQTKGLKATSGAAIFPNQNISPQSLNVDLKSDDPTVRIRTITFDAGRINYNINSTIAEKIRITINIPGALKNGVTMAPIVIDVNSSNKVGFIDLANVTFDLTSDNAQPYNKIKVDVTPQLISSNQVKNFDSSNFINASFSFANLGFKEINGYLGTQEIKIDPSETVLDFMDDFDSGFPLDDPKIKIFTTNSIGVPATVVLDAKGKSSSGAEQALNAPAFVIGYPTLAQKGQVISDTKVIDKNNSSIIAMLNLPPKTISFGGKATINAAGFQGYNDFIVKGAGIAVGYEVEMPMSLKTSGLKIEKTAENPFFEINNGTIGKSKLPIDTAQMEYVELVLRIDNGIPFDADLDMYFADKDTIIRDSITVGTLMRAAVPDATGKTAHNTTTIAVVKIPSAKLHSMQTGNLVNMVVRINIKTFDNGSTPVKLYSSYVSKIGMSVKVKLKLGAKKS